MGINFHERNFSSRYIICTLAQDGPPYTVVCLSALNGDLTVFAPLKIEMSEHTSHPYCGEVYEECRMSIAS